MLKQTEKYKSDIEEKKNKEDHRGNVLEMYGPTEFHRNGKMRCLLNGFTEKVTKKLKMTLKWIKWYNTF